MIRDPKELAAVFRIAWKQGAFQFPPELAHNIVGLLLARYGGMSRQQLESSSMESLTDKLKKLTNLPFFAQANSIQNERDLAARFGFVIGMSTRTIFRLIHRYVSIRSIRLSFTNQRRIWFSHEKST
jgi:hypothetical protein